MQNSFGAFTTLQREKEFAQYIFWAAITNEAKCLIEDLSHKPYQTYCNALRFNGEVFNDQAFGYPAINLFFVHPKSVQEFHEALEDWRTTYNLCFTSKNLTPITFDEYFIYNHNDFFPRIATDIFKLSEIETYRKYIELSDPEKDQIRIDYIQSKKWIVDYPQSTADRSIAEKQLATEKAAYKSKSEEKLKELKKKEIDWIPKKACEFLRHWSDFPNDYEKLFLHNSWGGTYESTQPPKGLAEFRTLNETPKSYADRMEKDAQEKIESDEMLSIPPRAYKKQYTAIIAEVALKHATEVQNDFLKKYPNLAPSKELPKLHLHFVWLIKSYVLGKQFVDISAEDESGLDIGNISREVKKLANLLGLPKPSHLKQGRQSKRVKN